MYSLYSTQKGLSNSIDREHIPVAGGDMQAPHGPDEDRSGGLDQR
jgi:hypothetical protein